MLGSWEWLIIAFIVVLLFGARKIPELGKGLGKGIRSFKEGLNAKEGEEPHGAEDRNVEGSEGKKLTP